MRFKCLILLVLISLSVNGLSNSLYLKSPLDAAVISVDQDSVLFSWNQLVGASSYTVQLSSTPGFASFTAFSAAGGARWIPQADLAGNSYWRVVSDNNAVSATRTFSLVNLSNLGPLAYHIHAEAGLNVISDKVADWNNLANANYPASQSISSLRPTWKNNEINGLSAVHFGGTGSSQHRLDLSPFVLEQPDFSLFISYKQESVNTALPYILGYESGGRSGGVHTRGSFGTYNNFGIYYSGPEVQRRPNFAGGLNWAIRSFVDNLIYFNSTEVSGYTGTGVDGLRFNTIGLRPDVPQLNFHGDLAEVIVYNTSLSNTDRQTVENYLINKYTPYPDLGKDTLVCGPSITIGFRTDHGYTSRVWSTGATDVDSIQITQNGTYWVRVESFGVSISDTINITGIVPPPQISIGNDTILCFGDSLVIDYQPLPGFNPTWFNGQTSNSIIVKDSSQFVQLSHRDADNCSASSDTFFVLVDSLNIQSTLGADRNICNGENIFVQSSSNQGPFAYSWSTGDTTAFTNAPSFGVQDIFVELTDFNACIFRDTVQINALNLPAPNVNFVADTACPNLPTSFTDLSTPAGTDNIIDWKWRFLNNDTASIPNPAYSFPEGIFDVELTVETDSGCTNSLIKAIRTHKQPVARITSPILCAQGEGPISSSSLAPVPDVIAAHHWLIDGNAYTGNSPIVNIDSTGFYDVQLIVESDKGCLDTTIQTIEVFPALLPDFEAANICIGDTTQFIETTPSFSVVSRNWNFGFFNQGSTAQNPSFYYPSTGSYTVSLSVENAIGCTNEVSKTVEIRELPTVDFGSSILCRERQSSFYDLSTSPMGSIVRQAWTINDSSRIGDTVNYVFSDLGPKDIRLEVEDNFGCVNAITSTLEVFDVPEVDFSFSPNYGEAPIDITFSNLSSTNAVDFFWDFGDGVGTSIEVEPVYSYSTNGTYTILLRGSTAEGCADSSFKEIPIIPTELDLALSNFSIQKTTLADGSIAYQPSVLLQNVGTRAIFNAELLLSVNNETSIAETWEGILPVGQSVFYTLDNFALIKNLEQLDYLCLEAGFVNDNTELNLSNNKACLIQQGAIQTSLLYPNPGQNEVHLNVIMENDDELSMAIYDLSGRLVLGSKNIALLEGYNKLSIETSTLQAGKYVVYLNYNDEIISHSLIIENP